MASRMEDVLDDIANCESFDALKLVWGDVVRELGYDGFAYLDARRSGMPENQLPFHLVNLPGAFLEKYAKENLLEYDPVVRRASTSNAPFVWSDCPEFVGAGLVRRGIKSKALQVMENALAFGFTQGYVIPCHAVDDQGRLASSLVNLFWRGDPGPMLTKEHTPVWLRLAAAYLHERVLVLRGIVGAAPSASVLTDREREILIWACRGKSRAETAEILCIADRTVEFHFCNAMKKLGVYNKYHAIAVAIHLGLISP